MSDLPEDIRYQFALRPHGEGALGRCVLVFEGTAALWDEARGALRSVGELRGYRLDLATARSEGLDQTTLLHGVSGEIGDFADTVLHDTRCLLPASADPALPGTACECIVYIAQLAVAPDLRGRGIGSTLLQRMGSMIDLTGCLVALKALPLASDYGEPVGQREIDGVTRFYLRQGFEPAGGPFMVKDARLCEAMKKRLQGRTGFPAR